MVPWMYHLQPVCSDDRKTETVEMWPVVRMANSAYNQPNTAVRGEPMKAGDSRGQKAQFGIDHVQGRRCSFRPTSQLSETAVTTTRVSDSEQYSCSTVVVVYTTWLHELYLHVVYVMHMCTCTTSNMTCTCVHVAACAVGVQRPVPCPT